MDFTDAVSYSGPQPVFSPDRKLLASAEGYRLVVRAADSLAVVSLCSCLDRVESISWGPDSDHLLCGLFKRATVQVFCVSDPDWACNIAEGLAGVVAARWTPDGQHILLTSDFAVRLSVWSLVDQSCVYLRGPKHVQAGLAFSPDGSQLAVAHVSGSNDGPARCLARRRQRLPACMHACLPGSDYAGATLVRLTPPPPAPKPLPAALRLQGRAGGVRLRHLAAPRPVRAAHRRPRRPRLVARRRLHRGLGVCALRAPAVRADPRGRLPHRLLSLQGPPAGYQGGQLEPLGPAAGAGRL